MNNLKVSLKVIGTVILLVWSAYCLSAPDYYTWVDENGITNFAERHPKGYEAQHVERENRFGFPAPRRAVSGPTAVTPAEETGASIAQQAAPEIAAAEARLREARANNCGIGKRNIAQLAIFARVRVQDADGTTRYLTDQEKAAKVAEAEQLVRENCS